VGEYSHPAKTLAITAGRISLATGRNRRTVRALHDQRRSIAFNRPFPQHTRARSNVRYTSQSLQTVIAEPVEQEHSQRLFLDADAPLAAVVNTKPRTSTFTRIFIWVLAIDIVLASLAAGIHLRRWMWIHTDDPHKSLRFDFDIENAHHWGSVILRHATAKALADGKGGRATDWRYFFPAYVELYDMVKADHPEGQYGLDYSPARLFIAAIWVRHERLEFPHIHAWVRPYIYTAPLLRLNTTCELLAALGLFLLVRYWVWRGNWPAGVVDKANRPPVPRRAWVLALLAALLFWFNAAVLFDAHVFPQWEVWLLPSFFFAAWLGSRGNWLLAGLVVPFGMMMKGQISMVLPLFILWPLFEGKPMAAVRFVIGFVVAATILILPWLVHGSFAWFEISFLYPTRHWQHLAGPGCDNLAAILEQFGWSLKDVAFTVPLPWHKTWEVPLKTLMVSLYIASLAVCSFAVARKSRRNDPAALIAIITPWLLLFSLLTQMHERYLLWAAACSAVCVAIGPGWGLLHLLLTAIATSAIVRVLLDFGGNRPDIPTLKHILQGMHPGVSWAVLLCAAIFLYGTLMPSRKSVDGGR
jgi:hypothetical protein